MNGDAMLLRLLLHMEWADATVWRAVLAAGAERDGEIAAKLHHIHLTQRAFLAVWRGTPFERQEPFDDARQTIRWARENYAELLPYAESLDDAAMQRLIDFPWAKHFTSVFGREPEAVPLPDTIAQLASHSTYHRGQVNLRLRQLGHEPPLVDYIAWLWMGKPATEWPPS